MKTLINVCGAGRSGTTMLDLILGNDPKAFSLGEVYAWFRPWRTHHFNIVCSCGKNPCPYWDLIKDFPEDQFHNAAFEKLKADFLVDSSKELTWIIDNNEWAQQNNIKVYNLLLYKDIESYLYSYWKRNRDLKLGLQNYINYYSRILQTNMNFVSIDYNKLVYSISETLLKICEYIGMAYFVGKENFWQKDHHHLFGSLGTRKQLEAKNSTIVSESKYPIEFQKITPTIKKITAKKNKLNKILKMLIDLDIDKAEFRADINSTPRITKKPAWYFYMKIKQKIKKNFPKYWPHEQ